MSKFMWKALLASPAVLAATLVVSVSAVRAASDASLLKDNSLAAPEVAQPKTLEAKTSQSQPMRQDGTPSPVPMASAPTASVATTPVFSTANQQAPVAGASQVAGTPTKQTPAAPVSPALTPQVAQVTPATPNNPENVLDQINRYSQEGNGNGKDQVTSITQLRDVSPGDWAFEALRSLVERYGCIAGYPDGTYRGNRALSRYEFAAGLNACLNQIERLIGDRGDVVTKKDLEALQRLVDEFKTELTTLGARVDKLEGRVAFLEDHQFSTTTKLQGEVIFALTDELNQPVTNNTVFQDRVRLTFNTSFTGRDRLVTRLAAGNATLFNSKDGTLNEGQQTFNIGNTGNNKVNVDWLAYYFNFGSSKAYLAATGGIHSDYAPTLNPYFEDYDGGNGALSTFASENPIYRIGGGAGAAISLGVGPLQSILGPSTLTLGYLAGPSANNPSQKNGLFDGDFAALAQLNFNLGDRIGIGATYVHGYHNQGTDIFDLGSGGLVVGSSAANNPSSFLRNSGLGRPLTPVVTNSYGGEAAFRLSDNISLSGFATYTEAILLGQGRGDIWTYGGGVAFPDLGKKGNVLGLFAGVEPTLRGVTAGLRPAGGFNRDDSWHFEGFYKYKLTDNISVTPGIIWLTAPGQKDSNADAVIGTLRTTFTF